MTNDGSSGRYPVGGEPGGDERLAGRGLEFKPGSPANHISIQFHPFSEPPRSAMRLARSPRFGWRMHPDPPRRQAHRAPNSIPSPAVDILDVHLLGAGSNHDSPGRDAYLDLHLRTVLTGRGLGYSSGRAGAYVRSLSALKPIRGHGRNDRIPISHVGLPRPLREA